MSRYLWQKWYNLLFTCYFLLNNYDFLLTGQLWHVNDLSTRSRQLGSGLVGGCHGDKTYMSLVQCLLHAKHSRQESVMIVLNNSNIYLLEIPSLKVRWFKVLKMDIPFTLFQYKCQPWTSEKANGCWLFFFSIDFLIN